MTTTKAKTKHRPFTMNPASPKVLAAFRKTGASVDDEDAVQDFLGKRYHNAVRREEKLWDADPCEAWMWITKTFLAAMRAES